MSDAPANANDVAIQPEIKLQQVSVLGMIFVMQLAILFQFSNDGKVTGSALSHFYANLSTYRQKYINSGT